MRSTRGFLMKVFVINLDRHPERLAHMREQLRGIAFDRVAAVDGAANPPTVKGLTRFELACLASHQKAWRRFLDGGGDYACFLEDDLHIRPDFDALISNEVWAPPDAHSVKLDTYFQKVKLGDPRPAPGGRQVAPLYTRHQSSAAYILSREGARTYLNLTATPTVPADYALFPRNPLKLGLRVYQLTPAIAIQDHLLRAEEGGQTFATGMAVSDAPAPGMFEKLAREAGRLISQVAHCGEAVYLEASLKPVTTTVALR
jgi:glycosyl transferase family 25